MLHPFDDRERLRPLYEAAPLVTVRARNILYGRRLPDVRVLVDTPGEPRGAMLSHDGMMWDLYAPEPSVAHAMLDDFEPRAGRFILVGIAEHLIEHACQRFELVVHTPTDLYVLADRADLRGLAPADGSLSSLGSLGPEHAALVAAAWPHDDFERPTGKLDYIRACIEQGPTVALVEQGELVSFVLTHTDGSMGVLHTDPARRNRGLGRRVLSMLAGRLLAQGAPLFGFVAVGNTPSAMLVESLGLRAMQRGAWLTMRC